MKNMKHNWLLALLVIGSFSSAAQANLVLDNAGGLIDNSKFPLVLDTNDFYATEFSLGTGQVITGIQAYINGGSSGAVGDQFTFHLYSADGSKGLPGTDLYSVDATYLVDGWNGLSNLNINGLTAGNYWLALEVGSSSSTAGLLLPIFSTAGTKPALAYAFSTGSGYTAMTDENIGLQVTAVPEPAVFWLFGSSLLSFIFCVRRKANNL